ncbi:hypothetical protein L204_105294 [Cryptococcus depauperatus]
MHRHDPDRSDTRSDSRRSRRRSEHPSEHPPTASQSNTTEADSNNGPATYLTGPFLAFPPIVYRGEHHMSPEAHNKRATELLRELDLTRDDLEPGDWEIMGKKQIHWTSDDDTVIDRLTGIPSSCERADLFERTSAYERERRRLSRLGDKTTQTEGSASAPDDPSCALEESYQEGGSRVAPPDRQTDQAWEGVSYEECVAAQREYYASMYASMYGGSSLGPGDTWNPSP